MINRILSIAMALLATVVGLYPALYFIVKERFGLLLSKDDALLKNTGWNTGFYTHITFGGLALLIGWIQFSNKLRTKKPTLHRQIGKVYVISVLLSAVAAMYISFYATSGFIAAFGFFLLGAVWFFSTLKAYVDIRNGRINSHQAMMIYSYAACMAAVTLRIYLPILQNIFNPLIGYRIDAWLCWVPNIMVAWLINRNIYRKRTTLLAAA
ncbi:MAG: DUF2306 domain-containing protein [Chitinophagaceae bacterium]